MKKVWWIAGGGIVLTGLVVASLTAGSRQKRTRVHAEEARAREITQAVKASGRIDPRVKVNISAHVIGKIEKLYVEEGQEVQAGKPFLELEKEAFIAVRDHWAAQLAMARTETRQAEVSLADARLKLDRSRRLTAEGISSNEQREAAELQYTSAELRLEQAREAVHQAQANLAKARDDLARTTIYAPLSGRVIALNAEEGEVVVSGTMNNPASVIGTIADLSEILVEVDVDETEVVHVQLGQSAEVEVDAVPEQIYRGRVVEIGSSGFSRAQQPDVTFFKAKVLLEDPDERLRPGMSARAEIEVTTREQAISVPIQAVVERSPEAGEKNNSKPGGNEEKPEEIKVVFVVEKERAKQRPVEVGISDSTHVEIVSGLAGGEQVVTGPYRSLKKLQDGDAVKPSKESNGKGRRNAKDSEDEDPDEEK